MDNFEAPRTSAPIAEGVPKQQEYERTQLLPLPKRQTSTRRLR